MTVRLPLLTYSVLVGSAGLLWGCHASRAYQRVAYPKSEPRPSAVASTAEETPDTNFVPTPPIRLTAAEFDSNASLPPVPPAAEDGSVEPSPHPAPGATGSSQGVSLSLIEALDIGLQQNPNLITLREQAGVSRAAVGVAETYPFNPIMQTRILPYGRLKHGGNSSVYNYVLFWQTFELAHQQQYREESAVAALEGVNWTIAQAELQTLSMTEQLYFTALYQRGLFDLAKANAKLNSDLLDVLQKQLEAGQASAADVAVVRLDSRATEQQTHLARANYETALEALRRQLNVAAETQLDVSGAITEFEWLPVNADEWPTEDASGMAVVTAESLAAALANGRPDVMAARHTLSASRANVSLAEASKIPNVMLGPFYVRDASGTVNLGLQAQMDLPVVNTGQPLVDQRAAEFRQQCTTLEQLESRAITEAQTALARYARARKLAAESGHSFQDSAPEELQKLEAQYRKGEVDVLRVMQARNSLLQLRRAHLDSLNEVAQAAAAVTAATGLPPHKLVRKRPKPSTTSFTPTDPASELYNAVSHDDAASLEASAEPAVDAFE